MSELINRLLSTTKDIVSVSKTGEIITPFRAQRIIAHYEREIAKQHMTVGSAVERVVADYSGSNNGAPRK